MATMLTGFVLALLAPGFAIAQGPLGTKQTLQQAYEESRVRRQSLHAGEKAATSKDAPVAEAVAQWYIHRTTHKFEKQDSLQADFAKEINNLMDKKNLATKRPYIDLLGRACVDNMKLVLSRDVAKDPTSVVNGAQLLATMARLRQDEVLGYLTGLVNDTKTHDVVRLYALKALREGMPIRIQLDPVLADAKFEKEDLKDKEQNLIRARDARTVDALTAFVERSAKGDNLSPEDVATRRFIRREAVAALASAGSPAVSAMAKPKAEAGYVAPTLMRVIAKQGGISPPPSLAEKVEAALGLCAMEYPNMPEYHSELAVYYVGQAILDLANDYNKDWGNFVRVGKDKVVPYHAYKTDAKRLIAGLDQLIANARPNPPTKKAAEELKIRARPVLDQIAVYQAADGPRLEDFNRALPGLRPKTATPFRTLKGAPIPE